MAALEQNAANDEALTEKQAFADLLAWSASRPAWQRDALRRLVQKGKLDCESACESDPLWWVMII